MAIPFTTRVEHARQSVLATQDMSATTFAEWCLERLRSLLAHHYDNPHTAVYRDLLQRHGLDWGTAPRRGLFRRRAVSRQRLPTDDTRSLPDLLERLPITDRAFLTQGRYHEQPAVPREQVAFTPTSSGTTSDQPLIIAYSHHTLWSVNADMIMMFPAFYGHDTATTTGYMVANFKRGLSVAQQPWATYGVFSALSDASEGHVRLGSIQDTMAQHIEQMQQGNVTWACSSPIFYSQLLARAQPEELQRLGIKLVLWGGMAQRESDYEQVMRVLGASHSVGFYVSTESNIAAFQIADRGPYAVLSDRQIIEIVDAAGQHVQPGETGDVLVTCLDQDATPIIRYRVGDQARYLGHFARDAAVWHDLNVDLPDAQSLASNPIARSITQHTMYFDQVSRAGGLSLAQGRVTYDEVAAMQRTMAQRGSPVPIFQLVKQRDTDGRDIISVRLEASAEQAATAETNARAVVAELAPALAALLAAGTVAPLRVEIFAPGTLAAGKFKVPPIIDETLAKTQAGLSIN